jgi:endo-1,4-beta-xylanase
MFQRLLCVLVLATGSIVASAQGGPILLWPNGAPGIQPNSPPDATRVTPDGERVITHIQQPSITPYLPAPASSTGAAVLVIPGGGHSEIWAEHEGANVAEFLRDHGIAAFVLRYRLAREKGSIYTVEGTELDDTQRAIRLIRARSREWKIDPNRIGVIGFSAGGELAELASSRYNDGNPSSADPIDPISSKTDFQALLYPAIPKDTRLTAQTPPTFLACGALDRPDISQGVPKLYLALIELHVPAELHIFSGIGHGFGIRPANPPDVREWPALFLAWMSRQGLLSGNR